MRNKFRHNITQTIFPESRKRDRISTQGLQGEIPIFYTLIMNALQLFKAPYIFAAKIKNLKIMGRKNLQRYLHTKKYREVFTDEEFMTFEFSAGITGYFDAWVVESNGKSRAVGNKASFKGKIRKGASLVVHFRVWNGSYDISYTCTSNGSGKTDPNNPGPFKGTVTTPEGFKKTISIPF